LASVCPLSYRYGSGEMRNLLSRENLLNKMVYVEKAVMRSLEEAGFAPRGCSEEVEKAGARVAVEDVDRMERETGHDTASLAILLAEHSGICGRYVHLGVTSNDVIDTAWALVLREALDLLLDRLAKVIAKIASLAREYRDLVCIGRTHGQHALPITLGFKFANYAYELARSYERIVEARKRLVRCKISGAVGTMAAWGEKGLIVQRTACRELGLEPHPITTQIAPRAGYAELVANLSILASQLDRLALEIRELARPEIGEVVIAPKMIGSSTMPHKNNPVVAERISGLSRILRGLAVSALENIVTMHERDLSNSSCERLLLPHTLLVADQMLIDTEKVLGSIRINREAIKRNLELLRGVIASECLMVKLVLRSGMPRHEAHRALSLLVRRSLDERRDFLEVFRESDLSSKLDSSDAYECFNYENYLGSYRELIDRALSYAENVLGKR